MALTRWTAWPSREALSGAGVPRALKVLDAFVYAGAATWFVVSAVRDGILHGWGPLVLVLVLAAATAGLWNFVRSTVEHALLRSLGWLALVAGAGVCTTAAGADLSAMVVFVAVSVRAVQRLPYAAALPIAAVGLGLVALMDDSGLVTDSVLVGSVLLSGYTHRLDAQARGAGFQLLAQERATREAVAEAASLAERARIAREIHDVLAHSLSAQLVHLEAARLLIERGGERDEVLRRVVGARGMAREGLAETRQALSALSGEMTPVEEFLREMVGATDGAVLEVRGERRDLSAETGLAVRRVAQEALTNVRKHARGAQVSVLFDYVDGREVSLEVRDSGGGVPADDLAASGSGYGLRGMRERAELLGGTLESGSEEGSGFTVRLRVPV